MAVYSHIVTKGLPAREIAAVIMARTRATGYRGPLIVGEDRMTFTIGQSVEMSPPLPLGGLPALDTKGQVFP